MKPHSHNARLCVSALPLCILLGLCSLGSQKVPPPSQKDIVGAWFGFDENRLLFCRVELDPKGQGFCSTVYVDNPARLYLVKNWTLDEFKLNIELDPVDKETEPLYMKGLAGKPELVLEIGGVGAKWKRKLELLNEQDVESRNRLTRERIGRYKAEKRQ